MYIRKECKLNTFSFVSLLSGCLLLTGCFSSPVSDQVVTAQTNQANSNQSNQNNSDQSDNQAIEPDISKILTKLCHQYGIDYDLTPNDNNPDYKLYQLVKFGFPREVTIEEAVAVYNKKAQCSELGRAQMPLRTEEVIAAIRAWECESEAFFDDRRKACAEFRKIADTGKMPKGSLIELGGEWVYNNLGYSVDIWSIHLSIRLDKYPHSLKDVPLFYRVIRLNYISSSPTQSKPSR